ncbi:hypothetical protein HYT58_02975, partial [Candidatus Woesearchaeota archaeon]|nr:hypothetical protein [Candidatus Woesearchaeota archaeon]
MKKGLMLFAVLMISSPLVAATIVLDEPTNSVYNFGDKIDVTGKIVEDKDYYGLFKIDMECEGNKQSMLIKSVSLRGNEDSLIKEQLSVTPEITGNCNLRGYLVVNNNEIDSTRSTPFRVTKELLGSFKIEQDSLQAGKLFFFDGEITRVNREKINGVAHIYFKKNGEIFFSDNKEIRKSVFSYEKDTSFMDAGSYNIDIQVEDDRGNEFLFTNALEFNLVNEITVTVETDKVHMFPGKTLRLRGKAIKLSGERVGKGQAEILFDDQKFTTDVLFGGFSYDLKLSKNIKSGEHNISITVQDDKGNRGYKGVVVVVDSVIAGLNVNLDKESYLPNDTVIVSASLIDQAGDLIDKEVEIEMLNPKGRSVLKDKFRTNEDVRMKLAEYSMPGEWIIRARVDKSKAEKLFMVEVVNLLKISVGTNKLLLDNIGNVPVKQLLEVKLVGEGVESSIKEDINIRVNESAFIDLSYGTITGEYDIYVQNQIFKKVHIDGVERASYDWIWYVLIGVIVFSILYVILNWRRWKIKTIRDRLERKKAEEVKRRLLAGKASKSEERGLRDYHMRMNEEIDKRRRNPFGMFTRFKKKEAEEYIPKPVKKEPEYNPLDLYQTTGRKETSWEKRARERRERFERKKGGG